MSNNAAFSETQKNYLQVVFTVYPAVVTSEFPSAHFPSLMVTVVTVSDIPGAEVVQVHSFSLLQALNPATAATATINNSFFITNKL
jgi:hypothetical protein